MKVQTATGGMVKRIVEISNGLIPANKLEKGFTQDELITNGILKEKLSEAWDEILRLQKASMLEEERQEKLKLFVTSIRVPAMEERKTRRLFKSRTFAHINSDIKFLSDTIPSQPEIKVNGYDVTERMTFEEMAELLVGKYNSTRRLEKAVIENDLTVSLAHIENLVERYENREKTINLNGHSDLWGNLFFVIGKDKLLYVIFVAQHFNVWHIKEAVLFKKFSNDYVSGGHLFVRNVLINN